MKKEDILKTLHKTVDYLINESSEDVCQICAYLWDFPPTPDDVEPCPHKRSNGCTACRNGIIEYFSREV